MIFTGHNGLGPWPCHVCTEPVSIDVVHVHHRDHDRSNNAPENLTAMHPGCHSRHHNPPKTHCPAGHPYAASNLYTRPDGKSDCRTCTRDASTRFSASHPD